jgi:hypothetical protein
MEATDTLYITSFSNISQDKDFIRISKSKNLFIIDTNNMKLPLEELLSWTDKIVSALQLKSEDFGILDFQVAKSHRISSLLHSFTNIIIFSPHYAQLGIHAQLNSYQFYNFNSTYILIADFIENVKEKDDVKKLFWQSLKKHYSI